MNVSMKNRKLAVRTFYNIDNDVKKAESADKEQAAAVVSARHALSQAKAEQRKEPCDFNAAKVQKCQQEYDTALIAQSESKAKVRTFRSEMRLFCFHQKNCLTGKARTLRA